MVKKYDELNVLEKEGLEQFLKKDGWTRCCITGPKSGLIPAMTKKINEKNITVRLQDFRADED